MRRVLLLVWFFACGPRPVGTAPAAPPVVDAAPAAADAGAGSSSWIETICAGRPACRLVETLEAGVDAEGSRLQVVKLALFAERPEDPDTGGGADGVEEGITDGVEGGADGAERDGAGDGDGDEAGAEADGCDPYEHWLLVSKGDEVRSTQKLLDICNDGYGAHGVGTDTVSVTDNRFAHTRTGGSRWSWDATTVVQLSPLVVLAESYHDGWDLSDNADGWRWSWAEARGEAAGNAPGCGPDGEPVLVGDGEGPPPHAYRYLILPVVTLPAAFVADGWRTTRLDTCSARADASATPTDDTIPDGYVVFGEAGTAEDTRLSVVAGPERTLFVEISDDVWTRGARKWIHDDHLELWLAPTAVSYLDPCTDERSMSKPVQWGISIFDGALTPAVGKPGPAQAPRVEVVPPVPGQPARLKLVLPAGHEAVTVVYSDGDDGAHQERLVATSDLKPRRTWTLGRLRPIPPEALVCEVVDGRLVARPTRRFRPETAVIDGYGRL